ncbi:MAG TPA: hypothetical protein VGE02_11795 [Gemmatimonadales bacterium]
MTQATPSTQAPAPPAPSAPPTPGVTVEVPGVGVMGAPLPGVPQTAQELSALRRRRSELSDQLVSASGRRDELVGELEGATGANRAGLEQRLQVLDERIVRLESDIAETGRQLTLAPAHLLGRSSTAGPTFGPEGLENGQVTAISIVGILFIGFPIAIAMARLMWKRAVTPAPRLAQDTTQRLQRMEQAVDTIAIEIERVSEGQRFLTRLFADPSGAPALGRGQRAAEPVRVPEPEGVRAPGAGA